MVRAGFPSLLSESKALCGRTEAANALPTRLRVFVASLKPTNIGVSGSDPRAIIARPAVLYALQLVPHRNRSESTTGKESPAAVLFA